MSLSEEQMIGYVRDGFLKYGPILSTSEVNELGEIIDKFASGRHPNSGKINVKLESAAESGKLADVPTRDRIWQLWDMYKHDEVIFNHACNPIILDIVGKLLDTEDIKLFTDQTLMKPAFHGSPVFWHNDSAYWTMIEPKELVSCWTAVDDATTKNGCLKMIPGSHNNGIWPSNNDDSQIGELPDESNSVPIVLKAGECNFHHSMTIHSSGENRTPHRRRGIVTSYMRSDSKWLGNPKYKPNFPLLRGRQYPGYV